MRGPSTSLRGVLLGLLLERPGHGGDLASRLSARLGETWRIDTNDVYRLLEQLEQTGLAVARVEPRRGDERRTHLVYHPTSESCAALTLWMETLLPREPVRLGLQAKLAVAREQDAPRLLVALEAYERECLTLAGLIGRERSGGPIVGLPAPRCSREAVTGQLQAEADWAARTRLRISSFASAHSRSPGAGSPAPNPSLESQALDFPLAGLRGS